MQQSKQHCSNLERLLYNSLATFFNFLYIGSDDEAEEDDRLSRHRRIHEPEVLSEGDEEQEDDDADAGEDDAQMDSDGGSTSGRQIYHLFYGTLF